ncbi:Heat shock protein HslJ [Blastococcus fimeti]|nr:Heat shock protein HslJ [Blastococcus fimeti]
MRRLVLLLAGVLALTACGSDPPSEGPDVTGEWQLASGSFIGADLPFPSGATATLTLSGGKANGTAFCNRFFASYELDESSFSIGDIGSTMMGCEPEVMAAESAYLEALAGVDTAVLDGADLLLTGAGIELRFGPVPVVPDSPLEGTRWALESLVDGATASSTLGESAVLVLASDGRAEAGTGCRTLSATWLLEDEALVLDDLLPDGAECPPDLVRQDEHVTAVLQAGPAVEIGEDRLALTAPDGRGLVYRAEG